MIIHEFMTMLQTHPGADKWRTCLRSSCGKDSTDAANGPDATDVAEAESTATGNKSLVQRKLLHLWQVHTHVSSLRRQWYSLPLVDIDSLFNDYSKKQWNSSKQISIAVVRQFLACIFGALPIAFWILRQTCCQFDCCSCLGLGTLRFWPRSAPF